MTTTNHQTVSNNGRSLVKTSRDRPTLSACMIVKNEEKFLAQCLQSIKNAVDEIIVVDTGSTDRTVEIAQSFGAKIYYHPWRNSFSEARNHSLSYATCDWILQIDADEALEQSDIPLIHNLLHTNSCNAMFVAIYSDAPDGRSKHYFPRLFRRGKAHFEGIVHNQLITQGVILPSEIRLYHYGYNLSKDEMKKKYKRTGDLLRRQTAENPHDTFALTNLIQNYRNEEDFDKVIELSEKALAMPIFQTDPSIRHQKQKICSDLAYALYNTEQLDKAERICSDVLKENPDYLDALYLLGCALLKKGDFSNAANYFKRFLIAKEKERNDPAFNMHIVDSYEFEDKAYNNIGMCYQNIGLIKEAEKAYKKAIELNNKESQYYLSLAHLYISQNRLNDAENLSNNAIILGIANHLMYLLLGKVYVMQEKTIDAIRAFKQSIQMDGKNTTAYIYLINLLIQTKQLEDAEETLNAIMPFHPNHTGFKCLMAKIKSKKGDKQNAIKFIHDIIKSNPSDSSIYLDLGNLCIEIEEFDMAVELLEKYLKTCPVDAKVIANIATCYARLGKYESAITGFQSVLKLDPACNQALQNLAALKEKLEVKPNR